MADFNGVPQPTWSWPSFSTGAQQTEGSAQYRGGDGTMPGHFDGGADFSSSTSGPQPATSGTSSSTSPSSGASPESARRYGPRTCRICLEVVQPTFHLPPEHVPGFLTSSRPRVTYDSEDPALGRLLRPCKCKGSSRFVHEGCLALWRTADPAMGSRNYWQCPTCKFQYRLQRMSWGRWLNSTLAQIGLTLFVFVAAMFALGFVADPIINLYLDPVDTVMYGVEKIPLAPDEDGRVSWTEHFIKGLASLGLLGFAKALLAMSPWQWWNVRSSGIMGSGSARHGTGRDRVASISWVVILMGVGTFLWVSDSCWTGAVIVDDSRLCSKACARGVGARSRWPRKESWTCHSMTTRKTRRQKSHMLLARLNNKTNAIHCSLASAYRLSSPHPEQAVYLLIISIYSISITLYIPQSFSHHLSCHTCPPWSAN